MALRSVQAGAVPTAAEIEANFADLHEPLNTVQATIEAERCLYCYDAPCIQACPTSIDIPTFIHQIRTKNLKGSALTILDSNILGGTCGRACPTEVLCEQSCVMHKRGEEPIKIGALQRHAVDHLIDQTEAGAPHPFTRAPSTGKTLAVVGAGPAGLAFAHRAALLGHEVTIYEARPKPGGLNEYGLAAYKMADDFARREVEFVLGVGGISIEYGKILGGNLSMHQLRADHDAVFLGLGLSTSKKLDIPGEDIPGVFDALDFIAAVRQAEDRSRLPVGREVIVIGGGNTAIDAAVQARRLGVPNVTLVYRRGEAEMGATDFERDLARLNGVNIRLWASPVAIEGGEMVSGVVFQDVRLLRGQLMPEGEPFVLRADMVLKAIGQKFDPAAVMGLEMHGSKLKIGEDYSTSLAGVFAGGDCVDAGEDLTVRAVEDGKRAAHACDRYLKGA